MSNNPEPIQVSLAILHSLGLHPQTPPRKLCASAVIENNQYGYYRLGIKSKWTNPEQGILRIPDDPKIEEERNAIIFGNARYASAIDVNSFIKVPLEFGRFLGPALTCLILKEGGVTTGIHHPNESFWKMVDTQLYFLAANGRTTTNFNIMLEHNEVKWLLGKFEDGATIHYLTPARHRRQPL